MELKGLVWEMLPEAIKTLLKGVKPMPDEKENAVLTTQEACDYLRISKPTYVKYIITGKIRGAKAGNGWRVLKSELERFLKGDES